MNSQVPRPVSEGNIVRAAAAINIVLGIWFFVSPWVYGASGQANAWNSWIIGAVITISAIVRLGSHSNRANWLNLLLGMWAFLSPWIYGYTANTGRFVNSLCVGILVTALAAMSYRGTQRTTALSR